MIDLMKNIDVIKEFLEAKKKGKIKICNTCGLISTDLTLFIPSRNTCKNCWAKYINERNKNK